MNLSNSLTPALAYLRRHISQEAVSNERLVLLSGGAVVLVALSLLFGFWSLTSRKGEELSKSRAAMIRLQAEVTGDQWPKRLETTQALKTQLSVRLFDAPTPGLAEAGFESWLRNRFTSYGGAPQQIQITRSPAVGRDGQTTSTLAGLQRMTAKVIAPFDQSVIMKVLGDLAEAEKIMVVDRFIVRAGANSRLEMDVSTFIRTNDANAGRAKP